MVRFLFWLAGTSGLVGGYGYLLRWLPELAGGIFGLSAPIITKIAPHCLRVAAAASALGLVVWLS